MSSKLRLVKIRVEDLAKEEFRQSAEILKREFLARGKPAEIAHFKKSQPEPLSDGEVELRILNETMVQGEVEVRGVREFHTVKLEDAVDKITELCDL
jgi:hypothetical protein